MSGASGHMPVFSLWLEKEGFQSSIPLMGQVTFAGISNIFGFYERQLGLFQEIVHLKSGFSSNIYTIFRPLISDFTPIGSLLVLFVLGFVFGIVYKTVVLSGKTRAVPLLIAFYATVMFSSYTSIWIWTSIILAFIGCLAIFWLLPLLAPKIAKGIDNRNPVYYAFASRARKPESINIE